MFIYNAFTKSDLISFTNEVLSHMLSSIRVADIEKVEGDVAVAVTARGAKLALIMCSFSSVSIMGFRSINKIKNKHKRWTYLVNGQAGVNLEPVLFSGEQGRRLYATAEKTAEFFRGMYSNMEDESERLAQVSKRVSWEARGNHVIQNNLLDSFKAMVEEDAYEEAFGFNYVNQGETAVLFSIDINTGSIVDKWVGEFDLSIMLAKASDDKCFYVTTVDSYNDDKMVGIAMAKVIWDHLGNVSTDEDGEKTDESFLHFVKGTDVNDVWHWVEDCFDVCIGDDILNNGKRGAA